MTVRCVTDKFEKDSVNRRIWKDRQIEPHQITFVSDAAEGDKSIVITTSENDGGVSCNTPCQRAELRLHNNYRPDYGEEVWYGFCFKVTGDINPTGSNRTVIGQWKAPGDDSPFLAQRFDNGVFHITVQDGQNRITVASAEGDPDRLTKFQSVIQTISSDPMLGMNAIKSRKSLSELRKVSYLKTGISLSEKIYAPLDTFRSDVENVTNFKAKELDDLFDEFDFIQEIEAYAIKPNIRTNQPVVKNLPDPKEDWVEMIYRIKGGRLGNYTGTNHEGEIDIWANGDLIAEVRGNLGYPLIVLPESTKMYFKFGLYRNYLPNTIHFHFDNFRQGKSKDDVE